MNLNELEKIVNFVKGLNSETMEILLSVLEDELKEFNALKKELIGNGEKPGLFHLRNAVVGDYIIESKERERKGFVVEDSSFWVTTIKELSGEKDE